MPIGGYDPDDLDDRLDELATDQDLDRLLTAEERRAYENGEQGLFDLLSEKDIESLLNRDSQTSHGA